MPDGERLWVGEVPISSTAARRGTRPHGRHRGGLERGSERAAAAPLLLLLLLLSLSLCAALLLLLSS